MAQGTSHWLARTFGLISVQNPKIKSSFELHEIPLALLPPVETGHVTAKLPGLCKPRPCAQDYCVWYETS